ncbi:hypothetical protein [Streptomyces huasconensis]|uniref:hypothetical protein n=1 Tax=Streptomyces huasconensis TaxID=1854574 RepID=UPI0036F89D38
MTPHERLAAEQIPTGTFGHARSPRPPDEPTPTWTPVQQAQHRADLLNALDGWTWNDEARHATRRHFRLIKDQTDAA